MRLTTYYIHEILLPTSLSGSLISCVPTTYVTIGDFLLHRAWRTVLLLFPSSLSTPLGSLLSESAEVSVVHSSDIHCAYAVASYPSPPTILYIGRTEPGGLDLFLAP